MTLPTAVGTKVVDLTGASVTSVTIDPSTPTTGTAPAIGDFLLLTVFSGQSVLISDPTGFTVLDKRVQGTRSGGFWRRIRQSGDTSYTFAIPSANGAQATLSWYRGVDPTLASFVAGTMFVRTVSQATTPVPGITTTVADTLVLTAAVEASTATETGVTSASAGSLFYFAPQTTSPQIHTTYLNTLGATTPGAVAANTITYPNAAANGFGIMLGLPPATASNTAPSAAFEFQRTGMAVQFLDKSIDLDGTITSRAWAFGDGATSTAASPTHTYAPGTYTATLTVTDDDGAASTVASRTVVVPSVPEANPGYDLYDKFSRYSDGLSPVDLPALTGQTWEVYSGPDEARGGYWDTPAGDTTAAYLFYTAPDEVRRFGCVFRFDTKGGTLTDDGATALSIWDDMTAPATRKSRCHMVLTPTAAQLTIYASTSPTSLGAVSFNTSKDADHTMLVELLGDNVKLYVDGTLRLNITDSRLVDPGNVRDVAWEPYYQNNALACRVRFSEVWADFGVTLPPLFLGGAAAQAFKVGSSPAQALKMGSTHLWP